MRENYTIISIALGLDSTSCDRSVTPSRVVLGLHKSQLCFSVSLSRLRDTMGNRKSLLMGGSEIIFPQKISE